MDCKVDDIYRRILKVLRSIQIISSHGTTTPPIQYVMFCGVRLWHSAIVPPHEDGPDYDLTFHSEKICYTNAWDAGTAT